MGRRTHRRQPIRDRGRLGPHPRVRRRPGRNVRPRRRGARPSRGEPLARPGRPRSGRCHRPRGGTPHLVPGDGEPRGGHLGHDDRAGLGRTRIGDPGDRRSPGIEPGASFRRPGRGDGVGGDRRRVRHRVPRPHRCGHLPRRAPRRSPKPACGHLHRQRGARRSPRGDPAPRRRTDPARGTSRHRPSRGRGAHRRRAGARQRPSVPVVARHTRPPAPTRDRPVGADGARRDRGDDRGHRGGGRP